MADDSRLRELAGRAGIATHWTGNDGVDREPTVLSLRHIMSSLGLACQSDADISESMAQLEKRARPDRLPPLITGSTGEPVSLPMQCSDNQQFHLEYQSGVRQDGVLNAGSDGRAILPAVQIAGYHQLEIQGQRVTLAIAPQRCWTFTDVADSERMWGPAVQTYGLYNVRDRRESLVDFGVGTFGDVGVLGRQAAAKGADAMMISPAHALFHGDPNHFSPYSPSSRFHYNPLLADPADVFSHNRLQGVLAAMHSATDSPVVAPGALIDWPQSGHSKHEFLRALYKSFVTYEGGAAGNPAWNAFTQFKANGGDRLYQHALFESLHGTQFAQDPGRWHWRDWGNGLGDPNSQQVASFAREHETDIDFHMFLQWLARSSLDAAQRQTKDAGMRIGLINDLAVGLNGGGSHAWSLQDDVLHGLAIGAPPDALAPRGQNWGLTTFSPFALRDSGFETFLATLRASLGPAGGLRIDHVMGLMRLWLIPEGGEAADGAYVSYPFEDLLRLTILESHRSRKIIIGEDLGTVPLGFRETLGKSGLAGMRVLLFERDDYGYRPPGHYPADAIAMTTTHDTPTLLGWQRALDVELRDALDQLPPGQSADMARRQRSGDKHAMRKAFGTAGMAPGAREHMMDEREQERFAASAIAFTGQSQSLFAAIPLEDIAGQIEQPNLPGTNTEHPNWRRRYGRPVETILDDGPAAGHLDALRLARPGRKDVKSPGTEKVAPAAPASDLRKNIA